MKHVTVQHKISDDLKIRPDHISHFRVTCPKLPKTLAYAQDLGIADLVVIGSVILHSLSQLIALFSSLRLTCR